MSKVEPLNSLPKKLNNRVHTVSTFKYSFNGRNYRTKKSLHTFKFIQKYENNDVKTRLEHVNHRRKRRKAPIDFNSSPGSGHRSHAKICVNH